MGLVRNVSFGAGLPAAAAPASTTPKTPAVFWLNLGYLTDIPNEETGELVPTFVSLVQGIALDTMAKMDVSKGSKPYLQRATAQNELRDDILEACKDLEPGEDRYLDGNIGGLQIQLHRVKAKAEAIEPSENPFRRKMTFA